MTAKKIAGFAVLVAVLGTGAWGVYEFAGDDPEAERKARLRQLEVPPQGAARFAFLMKQIPDVVSQVTCQCCARTLNECFTGACPVGCGPCNEQGRSAYLLYSSGRSIEDIQSYMAQHHPVYPAASRM